MGPFNRSFFEAGYDIVNLFHESDGNTDITGDWVKLRDYDRVGLLFVKGGAEDVDDLSFQLLQAKTAAGGNSKALNGFYGARGWYKKGTWTSQNTWTAITEITTADDQVAVGSAVPSGATRIVADVNTDALQVFIEFETAALDADNDFDWFTVFVEGDNADNAVLLSCWAILMGNRFPQAIPLTSIA